MVENRSVVSAGSEVFRQHSQVVSQCSWPARKSVRLRISGKTDDATVYQSVPYDHKSMNHSVSEYVRGQAHTNGMESFWASLKRGHQGTFHHMSVKHLHRHVTEFSGRHNIRSLDTIDQMQDVQTGLVGKQFMRRPHRA